MQAFLWSGRPNLKGLAWWTAIGFAQVAVFTPLDAGLFACSTARSPMKCGPSSLGGIGKLFWFPGLTLIGYGDRTGPASEIRGRGLIDAALSVQIMTFHREAGLRRAVRSVLAQRGVEPAAVEILMVDNSAEGSAR